MDSSLKQARELLHHPEPKYYSESAVTEEAIDLCESPPDVDGSFFVVIGGAKPGVVYASEAEAFDSVTENGDAFTPFASKEAVKSFFEESTRPESESPDDQSPATRNPELYVPVIGSYCQLRGGN